MCRASRLTPSGSLPSQGGPGTGGSASFVVCVHTGTRCSQRSSQTSHQLPRGKSWSQSPRQACVYGHTRPKWSWTISTPGLTTPATSGILAQRASSTCPQCSQLCLSSKPGAEAKRLGMSPKHSSRQAGRQHCAGRPRPGPGPPLRRQAGSGRNVVTQGGDPGAVVGRPIFLPDVSWGRQEDSPLEWRESLWNVPGGWERGPRAWAVPRRKCVIPSCGVTQQAGESGPL